MATCSVLFRSLHNPGGVDLLIESSSPLRLCHLGCSCAEDSEDAAKPAEGDSAAADPAAADAAAAAAPADARSDGADVASEVAASAAPSTESGGPTADAIRSGGGAADAAAAAGAAAEGATAGAGAAHGASSLDAPEDQEELEPHEEGSLEDDMGSFLIPKPMQSAGVLLVRGMPDHMCAASGVDCSTVRALHRPSDCVPMYCV